jgi:hypothetical protein
MGTAGETARRSRHRRFFAGLRFTFLAATFLFTFFFFFFLGLSAVCVKADAESILISALVSEAGWVSPFDAIFATAADVFSFDAMVWIPSV